MRAWLGLVAAMAGLLWSATALPQAAPDAETCNRVLDLAEPKISAERETVSRCVALCRAALADASRNQEPIRRTCNFQRFRNDRRPSWAQI